MGTVITHYAVIMDHPNVTLIAAGPEPFCRRALAEWIAKHPLTSTQEAEVLTRNPASTVVGIWREALAAHETAKDRLEALAADHVDNHPELDSTGEWARMRASHSAEENLRHWSSEADEATLTFHKTTNRGLYDHYIAVPLGDLDSSQASAFTDTVGKAPGMHAEI